MLADIPPGGKPPVMINERARSRTPGFAARPCHATLRRPGRVPWSAPAPCRCGACPASISGRVRRATPRPNGLTLPGKTSTHGAGVGGPCVTAASGNILLGRRPRTSRLYEASGPGLSRTRTKPSALRRTTEPREQGRFSGPDGCCYSPAYSAPSAVDPCPGWPDRAMVTDLGAHDRLGWRLRNESICPASGGPLRWSGKAMQGV